MYSSTMGGTPAMKQSRKRECSVVVAYAIVDSTFGRSAGVPAPWARCPCHVKHPSRLRRRTLLARHVRDERAFQVSHRLSQAMLILDQRDANVPFAVLTK